MGTSISEVQILNNIIQFEQKAHPAWNPKESFSTRIQQLPLYFLEVNHHSKDKRTQSVTVTHYVPCRAEMKALAEIISSCGKDLRVCDIGCGNGFLGSLLAREGVEIFGIDNRSYNQSQISSFHDENCYIVIETALENPEITFDIGFCSWMTPNANLTPEILSKNPLMIIHVFSPHRQSNGTPTTGKREAYIRPRHFKYLVGWRTVLPRDYFRPIGKKLNLNLAGNLETIKAVIVYIHEELGLIQAPTPLDFQASYDWDEERRFIDDYCLKRGLSTCRLEALPSFT